MSFIKSPTVVRMSNTFGLVAVGDIFVGKDSDLGVYAFSPIDTVAGENYVISATLAPTYTIGGARLEAHLDSWVNGFPYYSSGGYNLYYTEEYGWVYAVNTVPVGAAPREEKDADGKYVGDTFYSLSVLPSVGATAQMDPRGAIRDGGTQMKVATYWPRWVSTNQLGVYAPKDGAKGRRCFGSRSFLLHMNGSDPVEVVRSAHPDDNGYHTYGPIHFSISNDKWVIGSIGAISGWWEGDEPVKNGNVRFSFCKNDGSDAEGEDIVVEWRKFVMGDEKDTCYIGEVALWR